MSDVNERFASDEVIYKGPVAEVHKVGLRMNDGEVVTRDLIHFSGAAVLVPVLDDGAIVFIRNYRFAVGEKLLELPAGMLEPGEDPRRCAERELAEETGYRAGSIDRLGAFYTTPGATDENMHIFLATGLVDGPQDLETHEEIDVEVIPAAEVREKIRTGQLHDGKTIGALCLYWLRNGA